jgi:multidrug resistance protein
LHIVVAGTYFVFNSALGSSLTSGAQNAIADYFHVARSDIRMILPSSLYMAGFAVGPLIFGPLSEFLGRKPVLCVTFATYMIFTIACAVATSLPALLTFRFLCGLGGSAPNAVIGGLFADIYDDPHQRGMAMSCFIFVAIFPSLLGPIISGFVSTTSWRWTFWAGLIIGTPGFPLLFTIPETYMPVLLQRNGGAFGDVQYSGFQSTTSKLHPRSPTISCNICNFLGRPFIMFIQEPIVFFCSIYLSMIYSLLYLFFESYPLVFQGTFSTSNS